MSGDDTDDAGVEREYIDGTMSNVSFSKEPLTESEIETIYQTWSELVEDHDIVDSSGIVFPETCLRCGKDGKWDYQIMMYSSGRIQTELECGHCGVEYNQVGVVPNER